MTVVRQSLGYPRVLKIHLLQAVLQQSFRWVCTIIEGDSTLDSKLTSKTFIVSQSLNDLFDKVIHRISLKIPKRRFRIDRSVLDIRNDIIDLGIRREQGARGKGSRAVEFRLYLLLELGKASQGSMRLG
jgi:hypothetical protein